VALALEHEVLSPDKTFFDFGCGHGDDYRGLASLGFDAVGWDPLNHPDGTQRAGDVVNLGYVLNVIEDIRERAQVLRDAFRMAREVLIVAVRVDRTLKDAQQYGDGVITKRKTFQKIYSQTEFREYINETLQVDPVLADLGIAYIFKSEEAEARYLANRTFVRRQILTPDLQARFQAHPAARALAARMLELGRTPTDSEFDRWDELARDFGGLSRVGRLLSAVIDEDAFAGSVRQRAEDIQVYLAKMRLLGMRVPRTSALPAEIRLDLKATWGSLKRAREEALVLLFSLGQEAAVQAAMRESNVGKHVGDALYVHTSALEEVPPVLRLAEFAARRIVGEVECDLVKFSEKGRAVSFLRYPTFDTEAHPGLQSSIRVYLPRSNYQIREYGPANPFILHRKELLVGEDYPRRAEFAALSEAEDTADLLSATDIGTRRGWEAVLDRQGLHIVGHRLVGSQERLEPPPTTPVSAESPTSSISPAETAAMQDDSPAIAKFLEDLRSMKVHRGPAGPSPKKPAVLLAVLDMIGDGSLKENKIRFPELEGRLSALLQDITGKKVSGLNEPFVRLRTAPFWELRTPPDVPSSAVSSKKTLARDDVWAELPGDLFAALLPEDARQQVRAAIQATWLPRAPRTRPPARDAARGMES
jgi:DNA phosphorothioation-associated putative methyltransferase